MQVMLMLRFEHVQLTNFLCYESVSLSLANRGIVRVEGENGAGKSALFESILWALFGKTPRGLDSRDVIRYGADTAQVILHLTYQGHKYVVTRTVTPTAHTLVYDKDGAHYEFPSLKEAQQALHKELGYINVKLLEQTFYLKQYDNDTFLYLTDSKQKDILEDILGLTIFEHVYDILKDTYDRIQNLMLQHEQELSKVHVLIQNTSSYIAILDAQKESLQKSKPTIKKSELQNKLTVLNAKLQEYNEQLQQVLDQERKLTEELNLLAQQAQQIKSSVSMDTAFILKLYTYAVNTNTCPVCNQHIPTETKERMTKSITKLQQQMQSTQIEEIKTQLRDVQLELSTVRQREDKLRNLISTIEQEINKLEALKKEVTAHVSELDKLVLRINDKQQRLDALRSQLVQFKQRIQATNLVSVVELVRALIDAFGPQGIKNNILDEYVTLLNRYINDVLQYILPYITIKVSTYRYTKDKQLRRKLTLQIFYNDTETTLQALSGGERKRLEIATILALRRVVELLGRFRSNIIIFDEMFDQLDASGIERVIEYLRTYNDKESLFLISHSPYTFVADDIIQVKGGSVNA